MSVEIRPASAEEMGELGVLGGYVYGGSFGDGPDNVIATANRPEWTLCAFVDGKLASSFTNIPFTMRANGKAMPLAGVSTIGTQPEYRRQGLVRRIHTQAFADVRDAGQPVAALWASQAAIYQRYGYAMTTVCRHYAVDTVDIRFHDGDDGSGRVERIDTASAYDAVKAIYIDFVANGTCYLHRSKALWLQNALEEVEADGPLWVALCRDASGAPQGYVIYTLRSGKVDHAGRRQEIVVRDLAWLNQVRTVPCGAFWRATIWSGGCDAPADDPAWDAAVGRAAGTGSHAAGLGVDAATESELGVSCQRL